MTRAQHKTEAVRFVSQIGSADDPRLDHVGFFHRQRASWRMEADSFRRRRSICKVPSPAADV